MKKNLSKMLVAASIFAVSLTSCNNSFSSDDPTKNYFDGPDAPSGSVVTINSDSALVNNEDYLLFQKKDVSYGVALYSGASHHLVSFNSDPVTLRVRGPNSGLLNQFSETIYKAAYSQVETTHYGYSCKSVIETSNGSKFVIFDSYYLNGDSGFLIDRKVNVAKENAKDVGFASVYSLINADESNEVDDFQYFIPSILYKDTSNLGSGAIASNLYLDAIYVKETRMGLPMAMVHNISSGYYFSISHAYPEISANGIVGGGASGDVNSLIQYGAFGFTMEPISVDFIYPCAEGPVTYDSGSTWARRYHPVKVGVDHEVTLAISTNHTNSFNDSLVDSYLNSYKYIGSSVAKIDNNIAYDQAIEIFDSEYAQYGTSDISAGVPWQLALDGSDVNSKVMSFQMGFVGQQTSVGYQLYRAGKQRNNISLVTKGLNILNFWTSSRINSTYFPYIWWDPANTSSGGTYRSYSSFLRCMIDGMQGILDAYQYSKSIGDEHSQWLSVLINFTNHLVAKQNSNGSFCRAYTTSGTVANVPSDSDVQGSSTLNTPIAIRFLKEMYEVTNNASYLDSLTLAAEYSYSEIYQSLGKYVGGTPDNPNVVDKEAAIYALYAFRAAYEITNDSKYLSAALHAAVCALSWTFVYNFACPSSTSIIDPYNPFKNGNTIGFSIIATGHAGADSFSSYIWYDIYKIYQYTSISSLLDVSILIENGSKMSTDYYGTMGYVYRAQMPEASKISDFSFSSVMVWLPWGSIANIMPITQLVDDYGASSIESIA